MQTRYELLSLLEERRRLAENEFDGWVKQKKKKKKGKEEEEEIEKRISNNFHHHILEFPQHAASLKWKIENSSEVVKSCPIVDDGRAFSHPIQSLTQVTLVSSSNQFTDFVPFFLRCE